MNLKKSEKVSKDYLDFKLSEENYNYGNLN